MSNKCEKCGREKEFTGKVLTSLPPINEMKCPDCEPLFFCFSPHVGKFHIVKEGAKNIEWDGVGLPPVGVVAEVSVDEGLSWCSYKAVSEKNGMRLVEIGNFTEEFQSNNWAFRPILSEAERKREEAINKIQSHCHVDHRAPISAGQAIALYDAIAAGKIPGVRIE